MFMLLVGWNGLIAINIYLRLLLRHNVYISENISHWVTGHPANFTSGPGMWSSRLWRLTQLLLAERLWQEINQHNFQDASEKIGDILTVYELSAGNFKSICIFYNISTLAWCG